MNRRLRSLPTLALLALALLLAQWQGLAHRIAHAPAGGAVVALANTSADVSAVASAMTSSAQVGEAPHAGAHTAFAGHGSTDGGCLLFDHLCTSAAPPLALAVFGLALLSAVLPMLRSSATRHRAVWATRARAPPRD